MSVGYSKTRGERRRDDLGTHFVRLLYNICRVVKRVYGCVLCNTVVYSTCWIITVRILLYNSAAHDDVRERYCTDVINGPLCSRVQRDALPNTYTSYSILLYYVVSCACRTRFLNIFFTIVINGDRGCDDIEWFKDPRNTKKKTRRRSSTRRTPDTGAHGFTIVYNNANSR